MIDIQVGIIDMADGCVPSMVSQGVPSMVSRVTSPNSLQMGCAMEKGEDAFMAGLHVWK